MSAKRGPVRAPDEVKMLPSIGSPDPDLVFQVIVDSMREAAPGSAGNTAERLTTVNYRGDDNG